jgi:hypothetical protein
MRRLGTLLAALGAGLAVPTGAKEISRDFHERFEVAEGAKLVLRHGDGDVQVTTWDQDAVEVDVVYRGRFTMVGAGKEPDFSVEFEQSGNVIRVTGREGDVAMVGIYLSMDVAEHRYTIRAPAWLAVDTRGEDGSVRIVGLRGEVRCHLEDGSLRAERITAAVDVTTEDGSVQLADVKASDGSVSVADGDVRLERCSGTWSVRTEDGGVDLHEHRSGRLEVRSVDGSVHVQLVAGDAPEVDVESEDGSVEVEVGEGISTAFLLTAEDGLIGIEAPGAQRLAQDTGRAYGELGDAEGEVRIRTVDGSITLRAVGGGA